MDHALAWAADHGVVPDGPVTTPRPALWSTVRRLPTRDGVVWLKQNGPGTSYEAGLVRALVEMGAPHVLEPLAVDVARGWLLLPDGGPTLRSVLDRDPAPEHWEQALAGYAALQRATEHRVLPGAPDHRPERMPELAAELLTTQPVEHRADLEALLPRYASWCDDLATSGVAPAVDHGDLHDGNVFAGGRVFDWGDAALAFPFCSLLVTLRSARHRWPELDLARLRDAYLEPWTDTHSRTELELLALLATRVAKVARAASWVRALDGVPDPGEHREAAPGWLEELLEEDVF